MSTPLNIGDTAPDFTLLTVQATDQRDFSLSAMKGQKVVIYFYPKDDTPGCTKQACGFRDTLPDFEKLNTAVIGISKDTITKHEKFTNKYDLNIQLGSDESGEVCEKYGVWVEKNMYGKKYFGIQRATFLVDENGKIERIWPKVSVKGHIEDVLESVRQAKAA